MNYSELNLDSRLAAAINQLGYTQTTPIQEQTIPHIILGKDVAGLAQTGTGKTAAFLIPLIERILKSETDPQHERAFPDWKPFQSILILVPTRELAEQIYENVKLLTVGTGLTSYPFYGGTGYDKQKEALKNGLHFMISTPGRLIDLYKEHFVDFKKVRAIVFDEADRMFDMGFKDDMKYILGRIERNRQFLVFSATLNFDVLNTAYQFGAEPVEINISRDQAKADNVKDFIFHIGQDEKPQHLLSVIKKENPRQTIIFTNFKNSVDRIAQFLTDNGIPAMGLSSLMSQSQRNLVISQFKAENNKNVLVATDVAARGLDISDVDLVVNFEMPQDAESYVHRIGRTGRAGKEGKALSFVSEKDIESLSRVEEYTKKKIEAMYLEDEALIKEFKPMGSFKDFGDKRPHSDKRFSGSSDRSDRGPRPQRDGDRRNSRPLKGNSDRRKEGFNKEGSAAAAKPHHPVKEGSVQKPQSQNMNGKKPHAAKPHVKKDSQSQTQTAKKHVHKPNAHAAKNFRTKKPEGGLVQKVKGLFQKIFG